MDARRWWWLRLYFWQWQNRGRARPWHAVTAIAVWLVPCVLLPLWLAISGSGNVHIVRSALLSVDVPLALALAALTAAAIVAWRATPAPDAWLLLPGSPASRALHLARLPSTLRWPAGFAIGTLLLGASGDADPGTGELLMIAVLGLALGALLGWAVSDTRLSSARPPAAWRIRLRGAAALSWAPLHEVQRQLHLRRLALFSVPVMLAAPMGAAVQLVASTLAIYLPAFTLLLLLREALRTSEAMSRWIPATTLTAPRLQWWVWRLVLATTALCVAGFALYTLRARATGTT